MWQLCPKCGGKGWYMTVLRKYCTKKEVCSVCKGKSIISEITGLPPSLPKTEIKINNEDKPQ